MIIPSFFGEYASQPVLQTMIDDSLDTLQAKSWWRTMLDEDLPQWSLSFEQVIGRSRIEAAASIVDIDSPAPMRSNNRIEKYFGAIPSIKEKFVMKQSELRDLKALTQSQLLGGNQNVLKLIKKLYDHVSMAAVAGDRRIDILLIQAISTLAMDVSVTNNPDGAALGTVDLLAQTYQKQGVPTVWTDPASNPLIDIENYVDYIETNIGRNFGTIMMSKPQWLKFRRNAQVVDRLKSFFNIGKANATYSPTLANINEFMVNEMLPEIQVLNLVSGIEKDGDITAFRFFKDENLAFMPSGKIGTLKNAIPMEADSPIPGKEYATFGPTLVSKWADDDPYKEFTAMEMNACPAIDIDSIFLLKTDTVQANFTGAPVPTHS
jgi:hypothetical protein